MSFDLLNDKITRSTPEESKLLIKRYRYLSADYLSYMNVTLTKSNQEIWDTLFVLAFDITLQNGVLIGNVVTMKGEKRGKKGKKGKKGGAYSKKKQMYGYFFYCLFSIMMLIVCICNLTFSIDMKDMLLKGVDVDVDVDESDRGEGTSLQLQHSSPNVQKILNKKWNEGIKKIGKVTLVQSLRDLFTYETVALLTGFSSNIPDSLMTKITSATLHMKAEGYDLLRDINDKVGIPEFQRVKDRVDSYRDPNQFWQYAYAYVLPANWLMDLKEEFKERMDMAHDDVELMINNRMEEVFGRNLKELKFSVKQTIRQLRGLLLVIIALSVKIPYIFIKYKKYRDEHYAEHINDRNIDRDRNDRDMFMLEDRRMGNKKKTKKKGRKGKKSKKLKKKS
jgi:hypothetical protein